MDDAGVYQISDEVALIQTVDFFTPILDDPYDFGQVAAANALSDVYAMGGEPLTALNIACFPDGEMPISILGEILRGGTEKLNEAGVVLLGGHTVSDKELKFGLSVTGTVHPQKILRSEGAKPGDSLILTKPLGTGILSTALKNGKLGEESTEVLTRCMVELNRTAMETARAFTVHAAKDITGYGLAGHSAEMAEVSGVTLEFDLDEIPSLPDAISLIREGVTTGGEKANRQNLRGRYELAGRGEEDPFLNLVFDPQTSGGLFFSVPGVEVEGMLRALNEAGLEWSCLVGRVLERRGETLLRFI
jgi:selenide,water dikinase